MSQNTQQERGTLGDAGTGLIIVETVPAILTTTCGHCDGPIVDGFCEANELDRQVKDGQVVVALGPHEKNDDSTTELACSACGCTTFRYEENVVSYRKMEEFDAESMMLRINGYSEEGDGDDNPGLLCCDWSGGCGKALTLPEGVEIEWT